ncbi:MAG: family N-acetyltransferase [Aeromicrobium sp.]|nr:family N-acetyltransferase [Aeromicrobium sp.]
MSLVLRRLALDDEAQVLAAVAELAVDGGAWSGHYRPDLPWPEYVALVHGWEHGVDLPPGAPPLAELVADVEGTIVGRATIRFELDEFHRTLGGHVGYLVRPAFRGRGHATHMLRQAVEILRDRDICPALVTCDDDNVASAAVIERNGGILEAVVPGVRGVAKRRYWVI